MDVFSKKKRSEVMSRIRSRDSAPERAVRSLLHRAGLRFRLHVRALPGTPDIVLPRHRAVVLVHGCFWHCHRGCPAFRLPASNRRFWRKKLEGNVLRDRRQIRLLRGLGWRVFTVWECEVRRGGAAMLKLPERIVVRHHQHRADYSSRSSSR